MRLLPGSVNGVRAAWTTGLPEFAAIPDPDVAHGHHDAFRIDCSFVSNCLRGGVRAAGIMATVQGSGHCRITLEIE